MKKPPRSKQEWAEFIPPASVTRVKRKPRSRKKADQADKQYILDNIVRTDTNSSSVSTSAINQMELFDFMQMTKIFVHETSKANGK